MAADVREFTAVCPTCTRSKGTPTARGLLQPPPMPHCIYPTFHMAKVKPVVESPLVPVTPAPPPPRVVDGELAYTFKSLLAVHRRGGNFLSVMCLSGGERVFPPS